MPRRRADSAAVQRAASSATPIETETLGAFEDRVVLAGLPAGDFGTHRVLVNGRVVLADEMQDLAIHTVLRAEDAVTLVVLRVIPGGTACEAQFRVLELRPHQPPRVTPEFGTCDAQPTVSFHRDRLRMYFAGWLPMRLAVLDTLPPDIDPPQAELLEYRDGRMELIARGDRAYQLLGR